MFVVGLGSDDGSQRTYVPQRRPSFASAFPRRWVAFLQRFQQRSSVWTGGAPSTDTASEAATFHVEVKFHFWGLLFSRFDVKFLRAGRAVQIQPAQLQARAGDRDRTRAVVVETANTAGGPRQATADTARCLRRCGARPAPFVEGGLCALALRAVAGLHRCAAIRLVQPCQNISIASWHVKLKSTLQGSFRAGSDPKLCACVNAQLPSTTSAGTASWPSPRLSPTPAAPKLLSGAWSRPRRRGRPSSAPLKQCSAASRLRQSATVHSPCSSSARICVSTSADSGCAFFSCLAGPMLELLPQGCTFGSGAAEMSFDISTMVGDWEGESLVCVLRKESAEGGDWSVLEPQEALTIAEYDGESNDLRCIWAVIVLVVYASSRSLPESLEGHNRASRRCAGDDPAAFVLPRHERRHQRPRLHRRYRGHARRRLRH